MKIIRWVPGAVVSPNTITIPAAAPRICTVVSSEITRPASGLADHPAATVITGVADHPGAGIALGVIDHPAANVIAGVTTHLAAAVAASMALHTDDQVVAAIANHVAHAHPLLIQAVASVEAYGASGVGTADIESLTGQTIAGAAGTGGVQNSLAAQAHTAGATAVDNSGAGVLAHVAAAALAHGDGADLAHVAGADVPHVGATPVVAATPTKLTAAAISLSVNTLVGDLLTLIYREVGESVDTS